MPTGFPDYYGGLTLPVTVVEGGTGLTTITAHDVLIGAGTSAIVPVSPGTAGFVLTSNGAAADPSFQAVSVNVSGATGILPVANGGTGHNTFLSAGIPNRVANVNSGGNTASIGSTLLLTAGIVNAYRATVAVYLASPTLTSTITVTITFTLFTNGQSVNLVAAFALTGTNGVASGTFMFQADNTTAINYSTTFVNGGGLDSYSFDLSLEAL